MGLDMYLYASRYVGRWEHSLPEERAQADAILDAAGLAGYQIENAGVEVQATVMYWRKANSIHRWFVENCQGSVDDCRRAYVSVDQLVTLRDLCQRVLDHIELVPDMVSAAQTYEDGAWKSIMEPGQVILNPEVAQELLPATSGFFFGSTEYDQWYYEDLQRTRAGLDRVLDLHRADTKAGRFLDFYYHSSW